METYWSYFYTHPKRVYSISKKIATRFPAFVHKSIVYERSRKKVLKYESPSISGLVFVQGEHVDIQQCLNDWFVGHYLVKDRMTGLPVQIRPQEMEVFMKMVQIGERSVRFLVNDLDYYATGHPKIRITSGILAGMEGYILRLSRDRCLVTNIGNITVAISGIHKDAFENLDEFLDYEKNVLHHNTDDIPLSNL